MKKKELSPEEQERVETEFFRSEASRQIAEIRSRTEKKKRFIRCLPLNVLWPLWFMTMGIFIFEAFTRIAPFRQFDFWLVLWMTAATFGMWSLKQSLKELAQNKPEVGNGGNVSGEERSS